jgi:hypothetical protein
VGFQVEIQQIERTVPIEGATVVDFDHAAASTAIDTLRACRTSTCDQGTAICTARQGAIVSWSGFFRDEFDRASSMLDTMVTAAVDSLAAALSAVYGAVDDANELQRYYNRQREEQLEAVISPAPRAE